MTSSAAAETLHVSQLATLARHLERRGFDLTRWRQEVACPELTNGDPDARVPLATMNRAWRASLELTRSPALGLEVGCDYTFIAHSIFGHLIAHSDTLGESMRGACRYFLFVSGGMSMELTVKGETAFLSISTEDPDPQIWPSVTERVLASVHTVAVSETGGAFKCLRTEWGHPPPSHREAYERVFGAPCVFGVAVWRLVFHRSMLDLPLLHRNAELLSYFRQRLEERTALLAEPPSTRGLVRQKLPDLMDRGLLSAPEVAKAMHLSLRSLYRALASEGVTFQEVLDEVRRERCFRLMESRGQPLEHIAFACGFADASGFHRAFRRWTGQSPREFREERKAG